jgi:NHS family xanthosine MFS transporter
MNFLQFFIWGAWLITIANYWFGTMQWGSTEFGAIFLTLGISSLFMPTLTGIIADRWINAEKLYAILHILGGAVVFCFPMITSPDTFFWFMLLAMCFYMPTIALTNTIAYNALKSGGHDVVKAFPPIRVFGTIGFIAAMWITNLSGSKASEMQFYISAAASMVLGFYSFTLPKCPPQLQVVGKSSFVKMFGLDAFRLFANYKMALFFIFSMLLGASLQLTNMYGDVFLDEFKFNPMYGPDSFVVKYSTIIMSISQMSETIFILTIPFFLRKFGIKQVMLLSMVAWVLRFALFGFGDPAGGLWMLILSCIIYGMAFDFFNISGSLFVETECNPNMRASAQGLFMTMTNGFGTIIGSFVSGKLIATYFTVEKVVIENGQEMIKHEKEWPNIWFAFAAYGAVVAILFAILFRHKHNPEQISKTTVTH